MITNTFGVGAVCEGVLRALKNEESKNSKGDEALYWNLPVVVNHLLYEVDNY